MYAQSSIKRQKTIRDVTKPGENTSEIFQGVGRIEYKTENLNENVICYHYYNSSERMHGRTMEDWLKPCIFIGSCFTPSTNCSQRPWSDNTQSVDNYKKGIRALFELCIKLGVKFWAGHDRDIAPVGETIDETNSNIEQITDLINEYQLKTGIKPLWIGTDLKSCFRYKNGAITSTESSVVAYAGYQVKKTLDIAYKLGAEHILIPLLQESYTHLLNTDIAKEFKHLNRFLKLIVDYRDKIGYRGQLLIDIVSNNFKTLKEKSAYCDDSLSILCFLKHYNLDRYYKLNVSCGHEFYISNMYGSVGSVSIRNKHLTDVQAATLFLRSVVEKGGIHPGGLTIYLPNHNGPFESKDLAEAFITTIDCYAKALRTAIKLINDVELNKNIQMRYLSFASGWGAKFDCSETSLEECEVHVKKLSDAQIPSCTAARYEHWNSVLSRHVNL